MRGIGVATLIAVSTVLAALAFRNEAPQPQASRAPAAPVAPGARAPAAVMPASAAPGAGTTRARPVGESLVPELVAPPTESADAMARRRATMKLAVRDSHGALIDDLGVSSEQRDALLATLADLEEIQSTNRTGHGRPVSQAERKARIESVLGSSLAANFFELERLLPAYWELGQAASTLERGGAPLTGVQREGLLTILANTQVDRDEASETSRSELAREFEAKNEYERLVLELAPSVLNAKQTRLLFEQFQFRSAQRADSLLASRLHQPGGSLADTSVWYPVF